VHNGGCINDNFAKAITQKHGQYQCVECADELVAACKAKGINGKRLQITTENEMPLGLRDLDLQVSHWGRHDGVQIGDKVYDNIFKDGILRQDWENAFIVCRPSKINPITEIAF
jgi:hypothetical protein